MEGFGVHTFRLVNAEGRSTSVALANAWVYWRTQRLAGQLAEALSTRRVIEQAKGIIIARQGCSADQAFQLLVAMSQRSHVKLHDVAADLAETARNKAAAAQDPERS
jgi:AmiR/NasT family two-component response regulator